MRYRFVIVIAVLFLTGCGSFRIGGEPLPQQREHQQVLQSLDELISAYRDQNIFRFANLISEDYHLGKGGLEIRVQQDFSTFMDRDIRYTLNNITSDGGGKVFLSITFQRTLVDRFTTWRINTSGEASFIFIKEEEQYRLLTQHRPLFGISAE